MNLPDKQGVWRDTFVPVGIVAAIMILATFFNQETVWTRLTYAFSAVVAVALGVYMFVIAKRLVDNTIDLRYLISEADGKASLSRFQFLIFTFVIAMSLLVIIFSSNPPKFPDANSISPDIFALLGISGGSYLISKGIQTAGDTG